MALCSKCGKELADDAQFCSSCGTPVNGAAKEKSMAAADKAKEIGGKIKAAIDKLPFNKLAKKYSKYANYAACVIGVLLLIVIISAVTPNKSGKKSRSESYSVVTSSKSSEKADKKAEVKSKKKGSSRKQIDNFLDEYEKFVVKAEKAAQKNDMTSLMNMSAGAAEFAEKADNFEDADDWTASDAQRYMNLSNRYAAAVSKISGSIDSGSFDMGDFDLGSFSF